ncbi:MAG: hypothetical protein AAF152_07925 [Cyanobacteria bacterium P01_A01_bin.114]
MIGTTPSHKSVDYIVNEIFRLRRISRRTQQRLMTSLLEKRELNKQEEIQVKRVVDALHRGLLRVVD